MQKTHVLAIQMIVLFFPFVFLGVPVKQFQATENTELDFPLAVVVFNIFHFPKQVVNLPVFGLQIFYMLFSNNTDNKMALDYMLAQMLLNGNVPIFMQNLQLAQRYGGYSSMPLVYQDVVQCAQNGGAVEGSSYMNFFNRMRQTKQ